MTLHIVGDQTTPDETETVDFVVELVEVACDLAAVAVVLNDTQGLDVAGNYLHRASNIIAVELEINDKPPTRGEGA